MMTQNAFGSFEQKSSLAIVSRLDPDKSQDQLILHKFDLILSLSRVSWG